MKTISVICFFSMIFCLFYSILLIGSACFQRGNKTVSLATTPVTESLCEGYIHNISLQTIDKMKAIDQEILLRKESGVAFEKINKYFIQYKDVFLQKIIYKLDTTEVVFLQRVDSIEVDSIKSVVKDICFANATDSLILMENYTPLLCSVYKSGFITFSNNDLGTEDILDVIEANGKIIVVTQLRGATGFGARYFDVYSCESDPSSNIIVNKSLRQNIFELK